MDKGHSECPIESQYRLSGRTKRIVAFGTRIENSLRSNTSILSVGSVRFGCFQEAFLSDIPHLDGNGDGAVVGTKYGGVNFCFLHFFRKALGDEYVINAPTHVTLTCLPKVAPPCVVTVPLRK